MDTKTKDEVEALAAEALAAIPPDWAGSVRKENEMMSNAKKALARTDAVELFHIFRQGVKDRGELLAMLSQVMKHYAGSTDTPRFESESAISAMERVALAAIELATKTITNGHKP